MGIFSNARNIAKIKDNIHILQKQNQLQDKQIKQLVNYLNLLCIKLIDIMKCYMKWIQR